MRLLFGLGNPGRRYTFTRHNIGFLVLDYIADQFKVPFQSGNGDYLYCEVSILDTAVLLIKPTTFMNLSGLAVQQACSVFEAEYDETLIIFDDFHLNFGQLRFRAKGASGGHNGMESIVEAVSTDKIQRLKIGIGSTDVKHADYVLSKFSKSEQKELGRLLQVAAKGVECWVKCGIDTAMNDYNGNILINNQEV